LYFEVKMRIGKYGKKLFFAALVMFLWITSVKLVKAETLVKTLSGSGNQTFVYGSTFDNTSETAPLGNNMNDPTDHFWLFENITINQGTTINSADLTMTLSGSGGNNVNVKIAAQDVGNGTIPTSLEEFTSKEAQLTDQIIDWNLVPSGGWGTGISSPDITGVIQEIINRNDWDSGNSILIWLGNNNSDEWSKQDDIFS
jgi:hypothetical protein